ncbi:hypothetical protein U1Q18_000845 [Sarracenia purpurea var. burkii]
MGFHNAGADDGYSCLKDLRLEINGESGTFSLCFWLFLSNSTPFPSTILRQMCSEITCSVPFLVLDEKNVMLFPLLFIHKEARIPHNSTSWTEIPHASAKIVFPFGKWVHVGCEVATDLVRLHIDGEIVGERPLTSSLSNYSKLHGLGSISLAGTDGDDDMFQGYVHSLEVLLKPSSIKEHFVKDPPLQLSIDGSSAAEIEEDNDGVWSIVGGKASCRRNFSLDVILLDAFGVPINKGMEVIASLLYADNGAPVEKPDDAEAPLLTSYDGIEFACCDRPNKLTNGRASFKLKISQLSSKCENRLFRIRFDIPNLGRYPFFEALSSPIRCISRNRNTRNSSLTWKKSNSTIRLLSGSPSSGLDDGSSELLYSSVHEAKLSPSSKRVKLGQENSFATCKADLTMDRAEEECNSHAWTVNEDDNTYRSTLERIPDNHEETDNSPSDSESIEARNSNVKSMPSNRSPVSDTAIFKYCLGGLNERALLLKEVATEASEKELADFAQQVSLYLGCSHHGRQIIIAKRLVEEGTKAWDMISQNNPHVLWENVVCDIKQRFMKIACCSSRALTLQDIEILRRIGGCQELVAQENFEKMWCWLFPVAFTLSRDWVNAMWSSASPKWIEGFITKEEAESSLQGPEGLQDPGTFILRFPTSRSWPHPDAGNLVATYIGTDYNIHHRLLSLDFIFSSGEKKMTSTPLQDMLLAEPELSQLGRIIRIH